MGILVLSRGRLCLWDRCLTGPHHIVGKIELVESTCLLRAARRTGQCFIVSGSAGSCMHIMG